jgi:hypothetical protein
MLKSDGSLWVLGYNADGQLGDGTFSSTNHPEQIATNVTAISAECTGMHSLAGKADGSLWVAGYNAYGQLGDGFTNRTCTTFEQIVPLPLPVFTGATPARTNLQLTATCLYGGTYSLLVATNLNQPLAQWTPVWTNSITARGTNNFSVTLTNAVNPIVAQQFYLLQSQ